MLRHLGIAALAVLFGTGAVHGAQPEPCSAADRMSAAAAAPRNEPYPEQVMTALADPALPQSRIVVVGDSFAIRWPAAQRLKAFGLPSANLGVGGDKTENILWRIERIPTLRASRVIITAGTGNVVRDTPCRIALGVIAIAGQMHAKAPQAQIDVLSLLPRRGFDTKIDEANRLIANAAASLNFRFVDAHTAFQRACTVSPCDLYVSDQIHPSAAGYEIFAKLLTLPR